MARATETTEGYTRVGGGAGKAWFHVKSPIDTNSPADGLVDAPGGLVLDSVGASGAVVSYWLWIDRNGILHLKTSEPTDEDETTTFAAAKNIRHSTIGLDPKSLVQGSTLELATTITGVAQGDIVIFEAPAYTGGDATAFMVNLVGRVTTDTVRVKFTNILAAAAVDPHPGGATYRYTWIDLT